MNEEVTEGRAESGEGSKAGREKYTSGKGVKAKSVKSRKSRVRIFPTIKGALKSAAPYGTMFSTRSADRLYVISRKKWGTDKESQVGVRIAKGFTPGSATPNASWPSIKSHSIRTSIRHGGVSSSRLKKKYGAGEHRPEEKRYQGKPSIKKANEEVNPWAACNVSVGTKKTSKRERCIMHIKRKQGMKEQTNYEDLISEQPQTVGTMVAKKKAAVKRQLGGTTIGKKMPPKEEIEKARQAQADRIWRHAEEKHARGESPSAKRAKENASTEYEGSFLAEKRGKYARKKAATQRRRDIASAYGTRESPINPDDVRGGKNTQDPIKTGKARQNASTEYEGPTLREMLDYLVELAVKVDSPDERKARQKKEAMATAEKTLARKRAERESGYKAHPHTRNMPGPGMGSYETRRRRKKAALPDIT